MKTVRCRDAWTTDGSIQPTNYQVCSAARADPDPLLEHLLAQALGERADAELRQGEASARAVASPMPLLAPVTSATVPLSLCVMVPIIRR